MNRLKKKNIAISSFLLMCLIMITVVRNHSSAETGYETFFQANQAYKEGNYEKAASSYQELINAGKINGSIFYNLGNCYVRMNHPGKAILNYERARRFIPRDPDLDFNLRYARDRIKDRIDNSSSFSFSQWLNNFNWSEIFWSFVIINIFFWVILILRLWIKSEWTFYALMGLSLLWIVSGISTGIKWYVETHDTRGVVVVPQITVHAGPDEKDTILFKLHAGTIVTCEREDQGWRIIQLTPEKRGWTKSEWVDQITLPHHKTTGGLQP